LAQRLTRLVLNPKNPPFVGRGFSVVVALQLRDLLLLGHVQSFKRNARRLEAADVTFRAITVRKRGTAAWVVGDSSSIWATHDGGQTWQQTKNSNSGQFLSGLCFDEQGERGWAVGEAILRTINGGTSWSVQNGGMNGGRLQSVSCSSDGQHAWAVGNNNEVISTNDGGDHWYPVSLALNLPPRQLTTVKFTPDGRRGWITGDDGVIFATVDGGRTWAKQDSGTNVYLNGLRFDAGGKRGWAVGGSSTILSTNDGGLSWVTRASSAFSHLYSIHLDAPASRQGDDDDEAQNLSTTTH
jgi:photosystem II stability/assembly factor-like uncharacterized protein